jgi:hypothetical protein
MREHGQAKSRRNFRATLMEIQDSSSMKMTREKNAKLATQKVARIP